MKNGKTKKNEVSGRKNQSGREFNGNHFYIVNIEFGELKFSTTLQ